MQFKPTKAHRATLGFVLSEHPGPVAVSDLQREFGADAEQALAELAEVGLLNRNGALVRATPAAVYFDALRLP